MSAPKNAKAVLSQMSRVRSPRAQTFTDRRKEASRKACRGRVVL